MGGQCLSGLLPLDWPAVRHLDRIFALRWDRATETVDLDWRAQPHIVLNPDWVAPWRDDGFRLLAVLLHAVYHQVAGAHWRPTDAVDHLAFEAAVNRLVHHSLGGEAAALAPFYHNGAAANLLLLPPQPVQPPALPRWPWQRGPAVADRSGMVLRRLAVRLYSPHHPDSLESWRNRVRRLVTPAAASGTILIGRHVLADAGAEDGATAALRREVAAELASALSIEAAEAGDAPFAADLSALTGEQAVVRELAQWTPMVAGAIRRLAAGDERGSDAAPRPLPSPTQGPLPHPSRRGLVLQAHGVMPLLHPASVALPRRHGGGDKVHLYLDVSGSTQRLIGAMLGAVRATRRLVHPTVHLFSSQVTDIGIDDLAAGRYQTTGGTDLDCVAAHMAEHGIGRAVILTDGWIGQPAAAARAVLERARLVFVLVPEDATDAFVRPLGGTCVSLPEVERLGPAPI